jgi:serine/threonine protein kinase
MRKRIKNAEYKLDRSREDVSSYAINLIETMLRKEPEQRLSIHKILQSDFFKNQQMIEAK